MANNLFVSCELFRPEKNYDRIDLAINSICDISVKVHFSLWCLKTSLSAKQVCDQIKSAFDKNDSLIVIDTTNNQAAWINLKPEALKCLQDMS